MSYRRMYDQSSSGKENVVMKQESADSWYFCLELIIFVGMCYRLNTIIALLVPWLPDGGLINGAEALSKRNLDDIIVSQRLFTAWRE